MMKKGGVFFVSNWTFFLLHILWSMLFQMLHASMVVHFTSFFHILRINSFFVHTELRIESVRASTLARLLTRQGGRSFRSFAGMLVFVSNFFVSFRASNGSSLCKRKSWRGFSIPRLPLIPAAKQVLAPKTTVLGYRNNS